MLKIKGPPILSIGDKVIVTGSEICYGMIGRIIKFHLIPQKNVVLEEYVVKLENGIESIFGCLELSKMEEPDQIFKELLK